MDISISKFVNTFCILTAIICLSCNPSSRPNFDETGKREGASSGDSDVFIPGSNNGEACNPRIENCTATTAGGGSGNSGTTNPDDDIIIPETVDGGGTSSIFDPETDPDPVDDKDPNSCPEKSKEPHCCAAACPFSVPGNPGNKLSKPSAYPPPGHSSWEGLDKAGGCKVEEMTCKIWCPFVPCPPGSSCSNATEACWGARGDWTYEQNCASCCERQGSVWDYGIAACKDPNVHK